ncbi:MAG: response regulator [Shimia sp.]
MARLLCVDDDPDIRDLLTLSLTHVGHVVEVAGDGAEALAKAQTGRFALIVLDVGLPELHGFDVCRALRKTHETPILFLTARGDEVDRIVGLELGADDYVAKPFSPRELTARIAAILKRTEGGPATKALGRGVLQVDPERHRVTVGGQPVPVTAREMELLALLAERPDHVSPRPAMVDRVYGVGTAVSDRTLDSHVRNLRAKLRAAGCPDAIETVHGVGLRLGPCTGG